jgi:hypothetical protein
MSAFSQAATTALAVGFLEDGATRSERYVTMEDLGGLDDRAALVEKIPTGMKVRLVIDFVPEITGNAD